MNGGGTDVLDLSLFPSAKGSASLAVGGWEGFALQGLVPELVLDGRRRAPAAFLARREGERMTLEASFDGGVRLRLVVERVSLGSSALLVRPALELPRGSAATLNRVSLLVSAPGSRLSLGERPEAVRVLLEQGYSARVAPLGAIGTQKRQGSTEPNTAEESQSGSSAMYWLSWDRAARRAFLAGYQSSERFLGRIDTTVGPTGKVERWEIWLDGGDTVLHGGEPIALEDFLLATGDDPWRLLEEYADSVAARHHPVFPDTPPVSWCSWYPYRLSVSEERILANARIAAERLKPLGLSIMEVDLGWETAYLPSSFEENAQFPSGLGRLAAELQGLGFLLGAWKAPYTVSEHDPVVKEHPEWLIRDASGKPASYWTWFWRPHGDVYILDLTHPGAREHLAAKVRSLYERGVRYFKPDFISCAINDLAKRRHDPTVVAGGGTEASREGGRIIREALRDALVLNCGGPEMPGTGSFPLLYTCNDTGNTGYISTSFMQSNYHALATHLFKNRRWGILQPSCLCVGLPGGLEEARLRATAAFMSGGQIDISDDLTSLPEDRFRVLEQTLPPTGITARPVDLFDPIREPRVADYERSTRGEETGSAEAAAEIPAGSVWHARYGTDWDSWDLVAVFSFGGGDVREKPAMSSYAIPLELLGLGGKNGLEGYEFWSGQYLGNVPSRRANPPDTDHPGDVQELLTGNVPGRMDLTFHGPEVKLICLRERRAHPWIAGTSFHQSCGWELEELRWDEASRTLSGVLRRPAGSSGTITLSCAGKRPRDARAGGVAAPIRPGSRGAAVVTLVATSERTPWAVRFEL